MDSGGSGGVQETADQVQAQKNNTELWNYQQTTYKPFIDKFIAQKTGNAASGVEGRNVAGQVNAEVMKGASRITQQPGQPNAVNLTRQLDNTAGVEANAQATAAGKVKQRQIGSLQNIVDIGRGQKTSAGQAQDTIAGESLNTAIRDKQSDLQTQGAEQNAIGSLVGVAAASGKRMMNDPGQLYKDAGGNINNVDFGTFGDTSSMGW